jgi:hypothetical protein
MIRAIALLAAWGFTMTAAAAEPEAPAEPAEPTAAPAAEPAPAPRNDARGYVGFGLALAGHTLESGLGEAESSGGGFVVNGVGHSGKINPSLDIAFRGEGAIMGREFDGSGEEVADVLFEVDGGMRISELFMVTLGYTTQVTAYDNPEVATSYDVIPIGLGVLRTTDAGYLLAQLRLGGGRLSNDQDNDTESVGYAGIRLAVQHGFGSGVQFMAALGLDSYEVEDLDLTDEFVRLEFGLGFGL